MATQLARSNQGCQLPLFVALAGCSTRNQFILVVIAWDSLLRIIKFTTRSVHSHNCTLNETAISPKHGMGSKYCFYFTLKRKV